MSLCTAIGRGSLVPPRLSLPPEEGEEDSICWQEMGSIRWENTFRSILSGRKNVFITMLVMNSGHSQTNSKNGGYNAASEVLGQWDGAQHTDCACPAAWDLPLGKTTGGVMASACGWSTASSLLFTTARWCGFFAFEVSGRGIAIAQNLLANGPAGWESAASRWEKTAAGTEKRCGTGTAVGPGGLRQSKRSHSRPGQSWVPYCADRKHTRAL